MGVAGVLAKILFITGTWWWALAKFSGTRAIAGLFIRTALLLITCMAAEIALSWQFQRFTMSHMAHHGSSLIWVNLAIYLGITLIMFAIFFTRQWVESERRQRELTEIKLTTELNYLRSQIHPHFFFNTLNNLFSLAQQRGQVELSTALSRLSGLLRYMLYDAHATEVSLQQELNHLKDFIGLALMRFSAGEVNVQFDVSGDPDHARLAPMLLLPLVENAFKHGVEAEKVSTVGISVSAANDEIQFICSNPVRPSSKSEAPSGIGLVNVRRRLDLIYPGRHEFVIHNSDSVYTVLLKIKK